MRNIAYNSVDSQINGSDVALKPRTVVICYKGEGNGGHDRRSEVSKGRGRVKITRLNVGDVRLH